MDIVAHFVALDVTIQAALVTACLAFLGWLVQSLVNGPIERSRETFMSILTKRIEIVSQMKSYLVMINLAGDDHAESRKIKEMLQNTILHSANMGYLDQAMYADILEVAVLEPTDTKKIERMIASINRDIRKWSSKVEAETKFFVRYHSVDPLKRLAWMAYLLIRSTIILAMVFVATYWLVLQLLQMGPLRASIFCVVALIVIWQAVRIWKFFKWMLHLMCKAEK